MTVSVAILCWRRARQTGEFKPFWVLLGMGVMSWGVGEGLWSYWELILHRTDMFPAPADIGFLGLIPFAAAALVSLPRGRSTFASRLRTLLDGMIIAGSLLFISWATVLGPTFRSEFDTLLAKMTGVAYPVGDLVIITTVLFVVMSARGSQIRRALTLVAVGLLAIGVADSLLVWLSLHNAYSSGNPIDSVWDIGFLLIGLAALAAPAEAHADAIQGRRFARIGVLAPYPLVFIAMGAAAGVQIHRGTLGSFLFWNSMITISLVLTRQLLTVMDNVKLNRGLEAKIEERTLELKESEERLRALVQNSFDAISVISPDDTTIQFQTPSIERVLGYEPGHLLSSRFIDLVHVDDRGMLRAAIAEVLAKEGSNASIELRVRHTGQRWATVEAVITNLVDERSVRGIVLNIRDITQRKGLEDQLLHQAFHDGLTGLANRALFRDRVEHAIASSGRTPGAVAVLFLDLDGFKAVNDTLGHGIGDTLLRIVGERIKHVVRPGDTVARLGGDEFAILLERLENTSHVSEVAERIMQELQTPVSLEGRDVLARASIGIAIRSNDEDAKILMQDADMAMYSAKAHGKGRFEIFDNEMHQRLIERIELETELDRAIERDEFVLHYQPIVDTLTQEIVGVEALIRWDHPERGIIAPAHFVPIAEETGAIVPIGTWVTRRACSDLQALQRLSPSLYVSVNLSPRQLLDPEIVNDVASAIAEAGISPDALVLEITEGMLIDDAERTIELLNELKGLGVRLAVDDFGTGYSSLRYIKRFPIDILKIDRSFVTELAQGPEEAAIARAIVKLGKLLHLHTVAEGVETGEQFLTLRSMGCDLSQGYLFGRPTSLDDTIEMLERRGRSLQDAGVGATGIEPVASSV